MTSNDMLLAKRSQDYGIDLAVGECRFLQEQLDRFYSTAFSRSRYCGQKDVHYPVFGGNTSLIAKIKQLHLRLHGREPKHVVITGGAKQALLAACYALQSTGSFDSMWHHRPYWPSYPTIADLSVLDFIDHPRNGTIKIATAPNNPCGSEVIGLESLDILDAAYNHPVLYGSSGLPKAQISVFSAAKLFGLSGLRIGWAITDSQELAEHTAVYVEKTSSGVSRQSQEVLEFIVGLGGKTEFEKAVSRARQSLLDNGKTFLGYLEPFLDELQGLPANHRGMFAFLKPTDVEKFQHALDTTGVRLIPGVACGGEEGWHRLNCGTSSLQLEFGLSKIKKVMRT